MEIDEKIIEKHGLKQEEYNSILQLLKREPNLLELGIFQQRGTNIAHKSSRIHLKKLPTKGK